MNDLVSNCTSAVCDQYAIEYPDSGDPMCALAIMRMSESGGALHASIRFIVPRGRQYSSVYGVIKGLLHFLGGPDISLDHSCRAPSHASLAEAGLREGPSGGVYQLVVHPCDPLIAGFTILAHLEMSSFLRAHILRARYSVLIIRGL